MPVLRLELKVCEGCGGLWVRAQGRTNPYCVGCSQRLSDFPRGTRRPKPTVQRCRGGVSKGPIVMRRTETVSNVEVQ
jgi:hypothetical protein